MDYKKYIARNKITNRVAKGKIIKPLKCELCGKTGLINAYVRDYNKRASRKIKRDARIAARRARNPMPTRRQNAHNLQA